MFKQNIRNSYLALFSRVSYSERINMRETRAFAPCHITGFFQIFDYSPQPLLIGSRGAGVSLTKGVETKVRVESASKSSIEIMINGDSTQHFEVSEHVARAALSLYKGSFPTKNARLTVEHKTDVPVGAGFGSSGAAALSLAFALNQALGLNLSRIEAAQLAHIADAECKTGLGYPTWVSSCVRSSTRPQLGGPPPKRLVEVTTSPGCLHSPTLLRRRGARPLSRRSLLKSCGGPARARKPC